MSHKPFSALGTTLPKPPVQMKVDFPELFTYLNRVITQLENQFHSMNTPVGQNWQPTNTPTTGNKAFDADAATLQETSRALARLIDDLKKGGVLTAN